MDKISQEFAEIRELFGKVRNILERMMEQSILENEKELDLKEEIKIDNSINVMGEQQIDNFIDETLCDSEMSLIANTEWDDDIIFVHDNIVPQEETIVSIINYPNSYDIVPMGDNTFVTIQAREAKSVDINQTDSERELTCANIVEVQKMALSTTRDGGKYLLAECADEQVPAVLEAVHGQLHMGAGEFIRRVWDPGVHNSDGVECLSVYLILIYTDQASFS